MKLLKEYTVLAPTYDQRWSAYLDASLRMTLEKIADLPAERVLDVACGTGRLLEILSERSDSSMMVGIDKVPAMLNVARRRLGERALLLEGDAAQLPFDDANIQLVTCTNALHYFPNVDAALREIRRVISPNCNLVITDWCRNYTWMRMLNLILPWTQYAHTHTFSSNELEHSLSQAGFRINSESKGKIDWFWGLMTVHSTPV
jgi:ubiquinone/menaquinone biosynthesis C-methylase UbiE